MKHLLIKVFAIFVAIFAIFACTQDFEDINTNPNQPTVDKANPDLILPKIISEVGDELTSDLSWGFGNIVAQLVATNNFTGVDIYNWGTEEGTWNLFYRNARDAQNLEIIADERNNENLKAVALILKSYIFSYLTEMWGDVPYSQALEGKGINGEAIFEPVYDEQKDIYAGILADYATAVDLLGGTGSIGGDILFAGDVNKWKKLANSLRFRTIMRLEQKWGEMGIGAADLQAIVDSGIWMASNEDNAVLPYLSTSPNQWPLQTSRVGSFDEKRMSQRIEEILKNINDPRLEVLFRQVDNQDTPGVYAGIPNGLSEDNAINFNGGPKNQSRLGKRFRDTDEPANVDVDMTFMQYNEFAFLLAEAAEKGYISGDAATFYNNGIEATMEYYGILPSESYFVQEGVDYTKAVDQNARLELIGTQKWLGLFMVGLEAWFDFRRTGIPALEAGADALFDQVPVRIQYPDNEKVLNGANYEAVVARQGADEILTPTWLLK